MKLVDNIKMGRKSKRNHFDFSHDVNTTSSFGFCQPTLVQSVMPDSGVNLKSNSFIRLGYMPCPTFGRIKVKTDTVYVPMKDVFEAFDELISQNQYATRNSSGLVSSADTVTAGQLLNALFAACENWKILGDNAVPDTDIAQYDMAHYQNILKQLFVMGVEVNYSLDGSATVDELYSTRGEWNSIHNVWFRDKVKGNRWCINFLNWLANFVVSDAAGLGAIPSDNSAIENAFKKQLRTIFGSSVNDNGDTCQSTFINYLSNSDQQGDFPYFTVALPFVYNYDMACYFASLDETAQNIASGQNSTIKEFLIAWSKMPSSFGVLFDTARTSENADFIFEYAPNHAIVGKQGFDEVPNNQFALFSTAINTTTQVTSASQALHMRLTFHLTPFGKRVMKVLTACGINFGYPDKEVELTKIYAYFKAWFDVYNPNRTTTWKFTHCYNLIHTYYDYKIKMKDILNVEVNDIGGTNLQPSFGLTFLDFIRDLVYCNYYLDADPFTICTPNPLISANSPDDGSEQTLKEISNVPFYSGDVQSDFNISEYQMPSVNNNTLNSLSIKALERLYYLVNKESVLASNIAEYMKARYGVDIRSTRILDRSSYSCDISEVVSNINNEQTQMGEYAGKGIGSGSNGNIKFSVPEQGYIIQMMSIVPLGGYVQGNIPAQLHRYDFYTPELDSLGMEAVGTSELLARESIMNCFKADDAVFGFRPRYFGLKYKNNLNNGGFAFRSERASFLPYCLDRIFSEGNLGEDINTTFENAQAGTSARTFVTTKIEQPLSLVCDEIMRSLGLLEPFGNYNRIFYDTTGISDNFIVHMINDFDYFAPMKPFTAVNIFAASLAVR